MLIKQFSSMLKKTLYNLLAVTLIAMFWVLMYISGCSLLSNLPSGSVALMFYISALWILIPIIFFLVLWQRIFRHQGVKVKPYHYGLYFCTSLVLWLLLSIIMGLGPCYRYYILGTNYFGEVLFAIITLPLFLLETGYRVTCLSFPLLVLISLTIVFCIGILYGHRRCKL